jgi:hypothetical protein
MAETKVAAVQTQLNGIMDTIDVKILRPRMARASRAGIRTPPIRSPGACSLHTRAHRSQITDRAL